MLTLKSKVPHQYGILLLYGGFDHVVGFAVIWEEWIFTVNFISRFLFSILKALILQCICNIICSLTLVFTPLNEPHSYQHVYVRESGMHLQLKKQNEDLIWIGLGHHTKHAWKLGSSVQTGGWMECLIRQFHVHAHETCGNVTMEWMCVCARCEGDSWGEDTTRISSLFFFRFCSV